MGANENEIVRCQFVVRTGPFGGPRREFPTVPPPEAFARGIILADVDVQPFTQNMDEDVKIGVKVEATTPGAVRWYVREIVGLTDGDLAWGEVERQLGKYGP
jgi:hypothetical protein